MTKLDDAIRSLRDDVDGVSPRAPQTLTQALAKLHAPRPVWRARHVYFLVAAALLVGSVAWAAYRSWPRPTPSTSQPAVESPRPSSPPTPIPSPPTDAPEAVSVDLLPAATVEASSVRSSERPPAPVKEAPRASAELAAYEAAHRAHFDEKNWRAALAAWDDYLTRFPGTRWEPEVRYNRALCLLRLARIGEAREALAPFARGTYAGYRQQEARALLAATEGDGG